jgi:nucleoside-diphosphate-sugar epimerase
VELVPWPDDWDSIRVGDLRADPSKMADTFDWSSTVGLEAGISETIAYYRENENQYL